MNDRSLRPQMAARRIMLAAVAVLTVGLMACGGDDDSTEKSVVVVTFPTPSDPVGDEQLRTLREAWNQHTAAEDAQFCNTFTEDFAPKYPSNQAAMSAFIQNYGRANGVVLRFPAEEFIRGELQKCLDAL